jgi:lipoprotein-anchoring transpeptidase ErfK/SrfK
VKRLATVTILATIALAAFPAVAGARTLSEGMCGPDVHRLQHRLGLHTYLPPGYTPGCFDYRTLQAVMAFQGWAGFTRTGVAGAATQRQLHISRTPWPWTGSRHFRHIEIHKKKQILMVVGRLGRVIRTIHVSTAGPGHVTPTGHWHVYAKYRMSWSNLFHVWLPWASYVVGGDAMHSFASVPGYPASHGCIRIPAPEARWVYGKAPVGTPVWIK